MKITLSILMVAALATTVFAVDRYLTWSVKEDAYSVTFKSAKVSGSFQGLKANISFDERNPAVAHISATIDVSTINAGNWLKAKHAKSALDADEFPSIKFESTRVAKKGAAFEATGNLTIRDVTRQIVLPFTFTPGQGGGSFDGKFTIIPKDYHIERLGTPETVEINLKVPVTRNN
jgi:polyisoprenoid-binding protein YceI